MTQAQIPDQMTAVVLDSYSGAEALRVEQCPVPKPRQDEVLVKVAASPINPSDLAFLDGNGIRIMRRNRGCEVSRAKL